jgi:hypothetical protein
MLVLLFLLMHVVIGRNRLREGKELVTEQTGKFQCALMISGTVTRGQTSVFYRSGSIFLKIQNYTNIISLDVTPCSLVPNCINICSTLCLKFLRPTRLHAVTTHDVIFFTVFSARLSNTSSFSLAKQPFLSQSLL